MIIDGNQIAEQILSGLKQQKVPTKQLAAIVVGSDSASLSFLKQKQKAAEFLGVSFQLHQLSDTLSQTDLEKSVSEIAQRTDVGGVILQLPLPSQYRRESVIVQIPPGKDVDNLSGNASVLPPAVGALRHIIESVKMDIAGKSAIVVGSGLLIGTPIAGWLTKQGVAVHVIKKGEFEDSKLKGADVIVTGTGVPKLIRGAYVKPGALVVDYGYGQVGGRVVGDVDIESTGNVARWVTPTPGGTGPIVVAQLFENFFRICG